MKIFFQKKNIVWLLVLVIFFINADLFEIANAVSLSDGVLVSKDVFVLEPNLNKAEKELDRQMKLWNKRNLVKNDGFYFVTGYQSVAGQTDSTPYIAAWNDNIKNAVNVVAVVQDSHLKRGACLKISGLSETYIVLDKLNQKYNGRKKIDVLVKTKKEAHRITGKRRIKVLSPGSCGLKRLVNGKIREEKFYKRRRFKY